MPDFSSAASVQRYLQALEEQKKLEQQRAQFGVSFSGGSAPVMGPQPRPAAPAAPQPILSFNQPPAQMGPQPKPQPPVMGPQPRPVAPVTPPNPWQAALDSWRDGPPETSPVNIPVVYDVQPTTPTVGYGFDRPDTGPTGLDTVTTFSPSTVNAPSVQPYDPMAPAMPDKWGISRFGGGNLAVTNATLPLAAGAAAATIAGPAIGQGLKAVGNTIWDAFKDTVYGDPATAPTAPTPGGGADAWNPLGGDNVWAKSAQALGEWWQGSAAKERMDYDVAERAKERQRVGGLGWGEWLDEKYNAMAGSVGYLQDALARQTMGQGNALEIGGAIAGAGLNAVGSVLESTSPSAWAKDQLLNVASGMQAAQDAVNTMPLGEGNLPLGTVFGSAYETLTDPKVLESVTTPGTLTSGDLWKNIKNAYWGAQQSYVDALRPTAEQAQANTPEELDKQRQRSLLNWADPASVEKTFDALIDQTTQVTTLEQKAKEALAAAQDPNADEDTKSQLMAQAADYGAQAYKLENTHPIALVNENTNLARQMIMELLQPDITDLAGGALELLELTPAARRLTRATNEVVGQDENILAKLLDFAVTPENKAAVMAERSSYNPRALYKPSAWWTTGAAQSEIAADKLHRFVTNLMADVDTTGDAKLLLRQLAQDPAKLLQGMSANLFQSEGILARADDAGVVRFGNMGLLSNYGAQDTNLMYKALGLTGDKAAPLRIFQQMADGFLEKAESLKNGVLLNKVDFANEFLEAMQKQGYQYFNVADAAGAAQKSALGVAGNLFRKTVSPIYIYLNPGGWATNYISGVVGALGDKTFSLRSAAARNEHLAKIFGPVDPTVRGFEGAAGSMTAANQAAGGIFGPLKKAYGQIDESVGGRVYYSAVTHALQKTGKDVLQNAMAPVLQQLGITDLRQASSIINHLFETGYSGGNMVEEFNKLVTGQARVFSLSDVNAGWLDALPADSLSEFYDIIRKAPDGPTAQTQLTAWADKAAAYWDNLIQSSPVVPARHSWMTQEVTQDTADLAQAGKMAEKYAGVPAQTITEWKKQTAAAMQDSQRRMEALMNVVAESADPQNRYMLYNIWGQVTDMTTDVRAKLGDMAERAGMLPPEQRGQAWGKYWEEAQRLWSERNTKVNELLEAGASSVAKGEAFTPQLSTWDILERTARTNEQKLWDTLRLEPASGAFDQRLKQVIDAGRQLTDKAVARTYAAARRFAGTDAMDYIVSAERNVQMAGAQARAYLDEVLETTLQSGKWQDYYSIRNETWRQLRQYEQQVWGIAERNIVRDGLGAEKTTGLTFNNGFDGVVELVSPVEVKGQRTSRLGAEKTVTEQTYTDWIVRREDGTTTTVPDNMVPKELKDRYNGVTPDDIEGAVQDELDNIASAHPFAEEAQRILDDTTPTVADDGRQVTYVGGGVGPVEPGSMPVPPRPAPALDEVTGPVTPDVTPPAAPRDLPATKAQYNLYDTSEIPPSTTAGADELANALLALPTKNLESFIPVVVDQAGQVINEVMGAAAAAAKKLNPKKGELVSSITVTGPVDAIRRQVELLVNQEALPQAADFLKRAADNVKAMEYKATDIANLPPAAGTVDPALVDEVARALLATADNGQVTSVLPVVLRSAGFNPDTLDESFDLMANGLVMAAAQRAKELDPKIETINAWLVKGDSSVGSNLQQAFDMLRGEAPPAAPVQQAATIAQKAPPAGPTLLQQVQERLIADGLVEPDLAANVAKDLVDEAGNDAAKLTETYKQYKQMTAAPVQQAAGDLPARVTDVISQLPRGNRVPFTDITKNFTDEEWPLVYQELRKLQDDGQIALISLRGEKGKTSGGVLDPELWKYTRTVSGGDVPADIDWANLDDYRMGLYVKTEAQFAKPTTAAAPVGEVAPFIQPGAVANAAQAAPTTNTLQTLRDIAKQAGLPTANANGSPLDLPLWNAVKKYFADNNLQLTAKKLSDLTGQELDQAIKLVGERVGVTKASDMYRAQAAGGAAAAKELAALWDADATATLGLPKMETLAKQYRDGQRVFEFEDLYGTTVAGKQINNSNDVLKLVEQYIGLRADVANAQQTVKATQIYSKMSKAEILRAERDNLLKWGYSTEEINSATRNDILRYIEIATQKPLPDPAMVFFEGGVVPGMGELVERVKKALNLGGSGQVADLNKMADTTIKNTTAAGGMYAPDMAYAAQHAREQIANMLAYVNGNLDNIMAPKGAIAEGQALRAVNDFRKQVLPAWDNAKAVAAEYGDRMRSFTMVDFRNNTRLDEIMSLFFPYSFWSTRAMKNSRERMIFEPQIWRRMMQAHQYMGRVADQQGAPDRYDGLFPVNLGNGMTYYLRIDPSKYWPTLGLFMQNDYADPESANNALSFGLESVRSSGFNPYPWFDMVGKAATNLKDGKPIGEGFSAVDYVPMGKPLAWMATRVMGPNLPSALRPAFYEYNIGRELTTMVTEGAITAEQAQYTQELLRMMRTGEQPLPEMAAQRDTLNQILRTATERAANKELMSSATSWATGVQVKPYDQDEGQALQASQLYRDRGYDPTINPYGSETAQNATFDQYPELRPRFSQSAIQDQDKTRPGVSASFGKKIEVTSQARDGLYAAGDAAVDAYLKQNPMATKKEMADVRTQAITAAAGQYVDQAALDAYLKANPNAYYSDVVKFVTEELGKAYPSAELMETGQAKKNYNPVELKDKFQQDVLKQAAIKFPYPPYPERGSQEQIAAYMKEKEAIDQQRQAWQMAALTSGTTGGAQLVTAGPEGWQPWQSGLGTDAKTAGQLIEDNKYKYATDAEKKRLQEIEKYGNIDPKTGFNKWGYDAAGNYNPDYDTMGEKRKSWYDPKTGFNQYGYNAAGEYNPEYDKVGSKRGSGGAEFRAAAGNVQSYFGAGGLAMWNQYYALPKDSEAREKFKQENPVFRVMSLYGYNKAEMEQAFGLFGEEAVLKWAQAPASDGSPEAKAERDAYWDQNPQSFLFHSWLNGRPANFDERKAQGDDFKYNFGQDYAEAQKMFGDNIWQVVAGYKRGWDKTQTAAYFKANPKLGEFFDWWYGNSKQSGGSRAYGGGGFGGGGFRPYEQKERDQRGFSPWAPTPYVKPDELDNYLMPRENYINKWRPDNANTAWLNAGQRLAPGQLSKWTPGSKKTNG